MWLLSFQKEGNKCVSVLCTGLHPGSFSTTLVSHSRVEKQEIDIYELTTCNKDSLNWFRQQVRLLNIFVLWF